VNNFISAYTTDRKILYLRPKETDNYELKNSFLHGTRWWWN